MVFGIHTKVDRDVGFSKINIFIHTKVNIDVGFCRIDIVIYTQMLTRFLWSQHSHMPIRSWPGYLENLLLGFEVPVLRIVG
jgi:hypothetical protein